MALATLIAGQLERFVSLNAYQLAGHVTNLDFWISEADHAIKVLDDYEPRFLHLKEGESGYVESHRVTVSSPFDRDARVRPSPPKRISHRELQNARRAVIDAAYRFLIRLHAERLIDETGLRTICKRLNTGIHPTDLNLGA